MRFNMNRLSRTASLRLLTIALMVCVAVPLGLHLASVAPTSAHSIGQPTANAALDAGLSSNGDSEELTKNLLPGDFIVHCDNTPEAGAPVQPFDPILFNGTTSPHYHLFFGNNGVKQTTTDADLEQNPSKPATTCQDSQDTAAEWAPALYYRHDSQLPTNNDLWTQCQSTTLSPCPVNASDKHVYVRVYYVESVPTSDPNGYADEQYVPDSLQMVAGFPMATKPPCWGCTDPKTGQPELTDAKYQVYWDCGASPTVTTTISLWPYNCNANPNYSKDNLDGLVGIVTFPDCWDGRGLSTVDQSPNQKGYGSFGQPVFLSKTIPIPTGFSTKFDLAYENLATGQCPAGFPYHIPHISVRVHTLVTNPCPEYPDSDTADCMPGLSGTPPKIQLMVSTMGMNGGTPVPGPWYTMHADYWNTWQQGPVTPPTNPLTQGNGTLDDNVAYCLGKYISYTVKHSPCGFIKDGHYPPLNG